MTIIKSHEFFKKSTQKHCLSHFVFIFYGKDKGLIFELIAQFKEKIYLEYPHLFSLVVLDSVEIQKNQQSYGMK
ncbi:hypothetical protein [Candidatus Liberibacter africanus]|uniref:hypothetical protein n=1 Tax=Liberibacter africanus TaxID=34020 RepID=UPI001FD415D5|nr:hypothetical protein [Candidatus Liberibacter africanus]